MRLHRLQVDLTHHQEAPGQVGGDHRLESLSADGRQRRRKLPTGVVDQAVYAAMSGDDFGDGEAHCILVADVQGDGLGVAAVFGDLDGDPPQLFLSATADDHRRAERGQFMGDAAADAAAPTRHPMHLAGEQARAQHAGVAGKGISLLGPGTAHALVSSPVRIEAMLPSAYVNVNNMSLRGYLP